ncbi:MAG: hypothetical protein AB9882_00005 [Ignavibacteriaceae bacterium]
MNLSKTSLLIIPVILITILLSEATFATIRYVSKTGSSTPPYTSWETASDSISKCLGVCYTWDTVIIGKGIYKERFDINVPINLFGVSTDSCIIDGSELPSTPAFMTYVNKSLIMSGLTFRGINADVTAIMWIREFSTIRNCIFENARSAIGAFCGFTLENSLFRNVEDIASANLGYSPDRTATINNCLFYSKKNIQRVIHIEHGKQIITNNIILRIAPSSWGWYAIRTDTPDSFYVYNNLISNFGVGGIQISAGLNQIDTGQISNNMVCYNGEIMCHTKLKVVNNIIVKSNNGLNINTVAIPPLSYEGGYNMFWMNKKDTYNFPLKETDIIADPMFVKDTIPGSDMAFDFHLQAFSPGIDAGDPGILDVDGTRSDVGLFGGPLGQKYTYLDLAPKPPRNLTAQLTDGQILLTWNRNSEADLFKYRVYRDTVPGFIYDTSKIIGVVSDTFFVDNLPDYYRAGTYYYKITAIDSAFNQSPASEEITVVVTGAAEGPPVVTEEYKLLQNYPNPFNPSTVIPYRLKEGGYVKIMVYNLLGELVKVLQNGYQNPGYYEVGFSPTKEERRKGEGILEFETFYRNDVVSGIYLYRIEVIGEGNIPRFMDMKKMMLVK